MSAIAFSSNPELLSGSTWQQNSLKIKINYSKILSLTWIAANIIISSSVQSSSSDISDHLACSYIWLIRTASYCGKKTQNRWNIRVVIRTLIFANQIHQTDAVFAKKCFGKFSDDVKTDIKRINTDGQDASLHILRQFVDQTSSEINEKISINNPLQYFYASNATLPRSFTYPCRPIICRNGQSHHIMQAF